MFNAPIQVETFSWFVEDFDKRQRKKHQTRHARTGSFHYGKRGEAVKNDESRSGGAERKEKRQRRSTVHHGSSETPSKARGGNV